MTAGNSDKQSILVIDSNEAMLEGTKHALEQAGYRVITHARAAGSVALLLREKPDLVLVDVLMPNIAGDTLAALFVKAQPEGRTIILLHSALAPEILKERASTSGAHGYLQKSPDAFNLVRVIQRWLKPHAGVGPYPSSGRQRAVPSSIGESGLPYSSSAMRVAARVVDATPPSAVRDSARPSVSPQATPQVLFVAQDISILSEYRRQVQSLDLLAEFALSGAQALRRVRGEGPLDVIVCHAALSDMGGLDLHARLLEHDPRWRFRVLLIAERERSIPPGILTVREPVSAQSLIDGIEQALGRLSRSHRTTA
jgi:CheY-like chemotaxis protein